jgi:hypothetical protein
MQPTGRTGPELRSGASSLKDEAERRVVRAPARLQLMRKSLGCCIGRGGLILVGRTLSTCLALTLTLARVTWAQAHAYRIDEIGRVLGVKPIHAGSALPRGHREVQIWVGFGLIEPETFTRIHTDGASVRGSKIFWWSGTKDRAAEANADRDPNLISNGELYANLRQTAGCGPRRRRGEYELCTATLAPGQSWQGILQSLDSLGIDALPNGTAMGLDGWSIVVEVRDGASYRTYSYWVPEATAPEPEVRRAAAIVDLVSRIGYRE